MITVTDVNYTYHKVNCKLVHQIHVAIYYCSSQ